MTGYVLSLTRCQQAAPSRKLNSRAAWWTIPGMAVHVELVAGADSIPVELSEATFAGLVALSEQRGQSVESLLAASIATGLPQLEREVLGERFVGGLKTS
jgi:hypothetical protein